MKPPLVSISKGPNATGNFDIIRKPFDYLENRIPADSTWYPGEYIATCWVRHKRGRLYIGRLGYGSKHPDVPEGILWKPWAAYAYESPAGTLKSTLAPAMTLTLARRCARLQSLNTLDILRIPDGY